MTPVSFRGTPSKRHVHAELSTSILAGRQSASGDIMFVKWNIANDEAINVHIAAINVTNVELMRKNVIKWWRNFWRGFGLNASTIRPRIPDNINYKDRNQTISKKKLWIGLSYPKSQHQRILTIKPLQYGLSRALVLGAHQHSQSPKHETPSPTSIWK